MRFRTAQYQTVNSGEMASNYVLQPTPGQVGAITVFPGTDTNVPSDYSYAPEHAGIDPAFAGGFSSRRAGRIGRTPYSYLPPTANSAVKAGATPENVAYAGGGRNTGSPGEDVIADEEHGPFNPRIADGSIPTGAKAPVNRFPILRKLFGIKDQTGARDERIIPQSGDTYYGPEMTPAALGQNTFIVPNVRQTFDTPNVPGTGSTPDGQPYVAKAGRPTEDPQYDPMKVTVANTREVRVAGSPPFLPDRTKAGAAEPTGARVAQIPQWTFTRPFDKGIAEHMSGVKGVVRDPLAARPIATSDESFSIAAGHAGQSGYHKMTPAPGMTPSGPMPNTVRQVPVAWDNDLNVINTDGIGSNAPRGRTFRRG